MLSKSEMTACYGVRCRSAVAALAVAVACGATAACGGSGGTHGASPSLDLTLRPIATCPVSVTIPPDVSAVVPDAASPPTSVLRTGDAVAFAAPAGSRIGAVGTSDAPQNSVVCQGARGTGAQRRAIILGLGPGFVQVAVVVPGSKAVRRTLVTVTG